MTARRLLALAALAAALLLLVWACQHADPLPPIDGDGDTDSDADGDGDSDSDADGDGDSDGDSDGDGDADGGVDADAGGDAGADADVDSPVDGCASAGDCTLALNFHACCPCPLAWPRGAVRRDRCFIEGTEGARPEGCNDTCGGAECEPCATPSGVACEGGQCVTTFPGECSTAEDCGDGELCEVVDGESTCVPDPDECHGDGDCAQPGYVCREWRLDGVQYCWHPDSLCLSDEDCDYNHFCEDPEGVGVYECVDGAPQCRAGHDTTDCPAGQVCVDDDGDGRGDCRE